MDVEEFRGLTEILDKILNQLKSRLKVENVILMNKCN